MRRKVKLTQEIVMPQAGNSLRNTIYPKGCVMYQDESGYYYNNKISTLSIKLNIGEYEEYETPATRNEWLSEVTKMKKQDIAALAHELLAEKLELQAENERLRAALRGRLLKAKK